MHFVITALGSYGDVHPMVGLGVALTRRGHRVSLVANAYFENVVRDAGLDHLPLGTRQEYMELVHHPDIWHPVRAPLLVWRYACGSILERLYHLLVDQVVSGETVIVAHGLDIAGRIVGEKQRVPVAGVHFAPAIFLSKIAGVVPAIFLRKLAGVTPAIFLRKIAGVTAGVILAIFAPQSI